MTDCDVCQSPYSSKPALWLLTWVPVCTYPMWRGLSSLQQPVEYFLVWAAWKVAEVQKEPTNPLQRSGAVLPLSTPLFWVLSGCSLVSTSEVLQDWPFASGCGLMSSMLMWSAGGMSGEQCFPPCTSAEMLHFWNEVCSLHVKWHGTFSQLSWQPTGLAYCMLKSSQGQAFRRKKKKKKSLVGNCQSLVPD